jgi:hypothetical protein
MKKTHIHYLIILGVCLAAYFQVAFLQESLKWDNLDSYLPMRYFVSECLRNNLFPLWLPYQGLGCPIYGDLISTNYPEAFFTGRLIVYDNIVLQLFFTGYIVLAGIGMYKLSRQLKITAEMSVILAVAYALSGFFVGNGQHIQYTISGAWIPFILKYYLQLGTGVKTPVVLKFILFTYLQVSGGYPAHTIFLAYLLMVLFVVRIIRLIQKKNRQKLFAFLGANFFSLLMLGVMCLGIFLSIRQTSADMLRYKGMGYAMTTLNSLTPACLISLISPLTPASFPQLFGTDVSMNNLYFGVFVLVLFAYGITRPLTNKSLFFLLAGIVSLLTAMGPHFFLHRLAVEFLPLFNTFRHPANLRLFTILSLLLVTGIQWTRHPLTEEKNLSRFRKVMLISMSLLIMLALFSFTSGLWKGMQLHDLWMTVFGKDEAAGWYVPIFLQSLIAFVILLSGYILLFVYKVKRRMTVILMLVIAEIVLFTQFNAPYTVYYKNSDPFGIQKFLHSRPAGFPLPDHHTLIENTDKSVAYEELWVNTNTYAKTVSQDIFYPFVPAGINKLQEDTALLQGTLNHPLLFLAEKVLPQSRRESYPYNAETDRGTVFVPDSVFRRIGNRNYRQGDTIILLQVGPSRIEAEVRLSSERLCNLLQNNHPGWKVYIDDRETSSFTVSQTLIGTMVPAGNHRLRVEFRNPLYTSATLFSFSLFLLIFYLVLAFSLNGPWKIKGRKFSGWILAGIPAGLLLFLLLKPRVTYAERQETVNRDMNRTLAGIIAEKPGIRTFMILNAESPEPFKGVNLSDGILFQRLRVSADLVNAMNVLDTLSAERLIYAWSNVIDLPEMQDLIRLHYPVPGEQYTGERHFIKVFSRSPAAKENVNSLFMNDFERPYPGWSYDRLWVDSTKVFSGKYADKMTPGHEFGATFRYRVNGVPAEGLRIITSLRFLQEGTGSCHLVITVNREGKTLHYHAVDLNLFRKDKTIWNRGFASRHFSAKEIKEGDEILVYGWNSGKNPAVYTDDFLVKIE